MFRDVVLLRVQVMADDVCPVFSFNRLKEVVKGKARVYKRLRCFYAVKIG